MTDHYPAFHVSPVPEPGPDAVAPEVFRGIYGMPMFVTVPTDDLAASLEIDDLAEACETVLPGSTTGPQPTPWNTIDVHVRTPENTHVIMTAARPLDLGSAQARAFEAVGIPLPR
jgi:hypothetical protein